MIAEAEYVLNRFASVVDSVAADYGAELRRIDRMNSRVYENSTTVDMSEPIRDRKSELKKAVFVGVAVTGESTEPVGTEYDVQFERPVEVRVEGLHHSEWGQIDPDGDEGVPFGVLVDRLKTAVLDDRTYPDVTDNPDITHHTLSIRNDAPQMDRYSDFYRWDFDIVSEGYKRLP